MSHGGFRRARIRPEPSIAWKSTATRPKAEDEVDAMGSIEGPAATALKTAKSVRPVAKGVALSTPQGQTAAASATFLNRILKDRHARAQAVRVAQQDPKAGAAVKTIQSEYSRKKTAGTPNSQPKGSSPKGAPAKAPAPQRDGKGNNLLAPAFVSAPIPGTATTPTVVTTVSRAKTPLHYWQNGGF